MDRNERHFFYVDWSTLSLSAPVFANANQKPNATYTPVS